MALSGWCGTRGNPQCRWCRSVICSCACHGAKTAQPSHKVPAEVLGIRAAMRENRNEARAAALTADDPGPLTTSRTTERG